MLEIRALHTYYGLSHIIQGIDLMASSGEVVGIFGRNGVGKTTLLKTIAGWVRPARGEIRLDGEALDTASAETIAHRGVGFVPEDRRIFPGLTVRENLELGLSLRKEKSRASRRRALDDIFSRFPRLGERSKQLGTTLSGGEQQMLAMARAMVGAPKVLLIDEPSEGLAPMIAEQIFAIIAEMKRAGAIVLLVEQNVHAALALCDRFYAIERGRAILAGNAQIEADRAALIAAIAV
ncbi:MAG: ABC transporter ATP-binding protein [Methylobacteriaceae bacterium]|nr:ABC transporter ATP-binding protein [Methylobacteriaceae bacterium]